MRTFFAAALLLMAMSGCNSPSRSNPLQLAPSREDWEAAYSKLSPTEQASIKDTPIIFDASGLQVSGSIYHMSGWNLSDQLIDYERVDIAAICEGFNRTFGNGPKKTWKIVNTLSYEQIGAPNGVQKHRFQLNWAFRDSTGKIKILSAMDFGPGVKVIWEPSRQALAAEANQAFALTFLKLVLQLYVE